MTYSLNEADATAKKAARGAGYSWGLAEEAGKAMRWLSARDLDGCAALANVLTQFQDGRRTCRAPDVGGATWEAPVGRLCPLTTGAALSDRAESLRSAPIVLVSVLEPVLLLPFVASCARHLQTVVSVELPEAAAATDGDTISVTGGFPTLTDRLVVSVQGKVGQPRTRSWRVDPDPEVWDRLQRFAHRTYAPATEESRRAGAGAGLRDND